MSNLPKPLYYLVIIVIGLGSYFGGRFLVQALFTQYNINQAVSKADDPNSTPVISNEEARKEFDSGCLAVNYSGANFDQGKYCTCVFDSLVQAKGLNWMIKAGLNADDPAIQGEILPYATQCVRQQNINV